MSTESSSSPASSQRADRSGSWRSVAMPTEHGGWSLTAEPAVLGLLIAWSAPGLALGLAAMMAFVTRTPLKLVLVDLWRRRWLPRSRLAAAIAGVELVILLLLIAFAIRRAEPGFWWPLAAAAPLLGLELWYDMRSRSRRLIPELAGAIGIGSVATAIALADGADDRLAWGLWLVLAARSIAAIPFVRAQVLRAKDRVAATAPSDVAQAVAVVVAVVGAVTDLMPAASLLVLVAVAAWHVSELRRPPRRVAIIGASQVVVGLILIIVTAIAV